MSLGNIFKRTPAISALLKDIEELKEQVKSKSQNVIEDREEEKGEKFDVRAQLQMLHFLGFLDSLKNVGILEQKGEFFGALLNRNSQRARKPFSYINDLIFSKNKAEAKNIKKDLLKVKKAFSKFGLMEQEQEVIKAIEKLQEYYEYKL